MILSKPKALVQLAKLCKSTSAATTAAPATSTSAPFKIKVVSPEEIKSAEQYEFKPPAGDHPKNPYRHQHVPSEKWKYVFYVGVPVLVVLSIRAFILEEEEEKNVHHHRPEYVPVEYMRIQRTPWPWGDGKHTLFHNPKRNPVPGVGYEA